MKATIQRCLGVTAHLSLENAADKKTKALDMKHHKSLNEKAV